MEGRTGLNNHLKMIRRVTLCGADQGSKSLKPLIFEIRATPFFKHTILAENRKIYYYVLSVFYKLQVRHRFLGFLMQEIHCNYYFYERTFTFQDIGHTLFGPTILAKKYISKNMGVS